MNRRSQLSHTIYSYCILNFGPDPVIVITPTPVLRYAVPIDDGEEGLVTTGISLLSERIGLSKLSDPEVGASIQ